MTTHQVKLEKGRNGWKASTRVDLEGQRLLTIETSKHEIRGVAAGVSSTAYVGKRDGHFISYDLFGDFRKTVATDSISKCTEKSVTRLHATALASVDAVIAEVKAYYAAKDAKETEAA